MSTTARILIACPDAHGIVAAVAGFVANHGGNLLELDQHTDIEHGEFFMRVEFDVDACDLTRETFEDHWLPLATRYDMNWQANWSNDVKRMGILVSRQTHCLHDLVWRQQEGEFSADIAVIVSNHDSKSLKQLCTQTGISFHACPIAPGGRDEQERLVDRIMTDVGCDFIVLARYMQILSRQFLQGRENRVINIHHSFLPAFAGSDPYRQAYDHGVKVIGATSHYVTADLDAGPIITQSVIETTHRDAVTDLCRKGRDLERTVLARAVRLHLEDKILVSQNKTVVFH